jgi:cardiolipin synthase
MSPKVRATPTEGSPAPTDALLTVPNLLTIFRLLLIPPFVWLALGPHRVGWAMIVAMLGFATDLVDGPIARRYGQVSKLGIILDPVSDRLGLAAAAIVLVALHLVPLWLVLLVVVRDAGLVLVGGPLLKARGAPIPAVTRLGKRASFAVSVMFALFLASGIAHGGAPPSHPLKVAGWIVAAFAVPAYYASTVQYIRTGLRSMSEVKG